MEVCPYNRQLFNMYMSVFPKVWLVSIWYKYENLEVCKVTFTRENQCMFDEHEKLQGYTQIQDS
jgi:hypothetical protein